MLGFTLQDIYDKHSGVFKGRGALGPDLYLETNTNTPPVKIPTRKIPKALKQSFRNYLDELVQQDVINEMSACAAALWLTEGLTGNSGCAWTLDL